MHHLTLPDEMHWCLYSPKYHKKEKKLQKKRENLYCLTPNILKTYEVASNIFKTEDCFAYFQILKYVCTFLKSELWAPLLK